MSSITVKKGKWEICYKDETKHMYIDYIITMVQEFAKQIKEDK